MHLRGWLSGLLVALGCLLPAAAQDARFIRLHNTTVTTPPAPDAKSRAAAVAKATPPVSGLYLLQLDGTPSAPQREALQARGVRLLHPVPDDAFVCHLEASPAAEVRALPYVRWLGEYQPEWRIDRRLAAAIGSRPADPLEVRLLLRPHSPPAVLVAALRQFTGAIHRRPGAGAVAIGPLDRARRTHEAGGRDRHRDRPWRRRDSGKTRPGPTPWVRRSGRDGGRRRLRARHRRCRHHA
ncbi:MAG: hypothetical protein LW626_06105 [Verrucomicrobium sp.]|nr:hypothetical protein [Verrucomicrobium sp.]